MNRDVLKILYKASFFFLVLVLIIGTCSATPPLPCEYYGSVLIDNVPAPAGTKIVALINGIDHGQIITETAGFYGGPALFDRRLTVAATEDELASASDTLQISFEIDGILADQNTEYIPGLSRQLDITTGGAAGTNPTPTTIPEINNQDILPPQAVSEVTTPTTYVADDGSARLSFDAGVQILAEGVSVDQVEILRTDEKMLPPMPDPSRNIFTGYGYRVTPDGAVFIPQGTFIITIPPEELQGFVSRFAVLKIFSPATGGWQDLNTAINTNAGEVQAPVTWATAYALFEQNVTLSPDIGSNSVPVGPISTPGSSAGYGNESGSSMIVTPPVQTLPPVYPSVTVPIPLPTATSEMLSSSVESDENAVMQQQGMPNQLSVVQKGVDAVSHILSDLMNYGKGGINSVQQRLHGPVVYGIALALVIIILNVIVFRCYMYRNKE